MRNYRHDTWEFVAAQWLDGDNVTVTLQPVKDIVLPVVVNYTLEFSQHYWLSSFLTIFFLLGFLLVIELAHRQMRMFVLHSRALCGNNHLCFFYLVDVMCMWIVRWRAIWRHQWTAICEQRQHASHCNHSILVHWNRCISATTTRALALVSIFISFVLFMNLWFNNNNKI